MSVEQILIIIIVVLVVIALLFGIITGLLWAIYKKGAISRTDQVIATPRHIDNKPTESEMLLERATSQIATQTPALDKVSVAPVAVENHEKKATRPADVMSKEQTDALNVMMSDVPAIFLTGAAGTGKSYLLKHFRTACPLNCVVLAPTGMAALNAGGQTIHSFFHFPARTLNRDEIKHVRDGMLYKKLDLIIIDEVSMVRVDLLDNIDAFMRKNGKDSTKPFGGARIIFVGDLYQLPPVVDGPQVQQFLEQYNSSYFYSAQVLDSCPVETIELREVHRQKDREFIDVLNAIRVDQVSNNQITWLNETANLSKAPSHSVTLTPTRNAANDANQAKLAQLIGQEVTCIARHEGDISFFHKNRSKLPVELELKLKVGAQVMFIKNDIERRWVNGTIGVIESIKDDIIDVRIIGEPSDSMKVAVSRDSWPSVEYTYNSATKRIESKEVGVIEQFPLALAWAMTIHKSQGATYDFVNVDLGDGAFAGGQTYVALSRCRTPQGLSLAKPLRHIDIKVDPKLATWREDICRAR